MLNSIREYEVNRAHQTETRPQKIPAGTDTHVEYGESHENNKGDDLLNNLELGQRKVPITDSVGGNLKAIFKKSDPPTDGDRHEKRFVVHVFQVTVPRKRHENV